MNKTKKVLENFQNITQNFTLLIYGYIFKI